MTFDKYTVVGPDGKKLTRLNETLAIRQKLSDERIAALVMSHQVKHMLFEAAKTVLDEPLKLRMLAKMFDELEFEQQKLWGFEQSKNHHFFWQFPGCKCPKLDNRDWWGTPYTIKAQDCPIHGIL